MEVKVLKGILDANDRIAADNRRLLDARNIFALNVMASPGAGKTSVILATIRMLREQLRIGVIEGDISSTVDADDCCCGRHPGGPDQHGRQLPSGREHDRDGAE